MQNIKLNNTKIRNKEFLKNINLNNYSFKFFKQKNGKSISLSNCVRKGNLAFLLNFLLEFLLEG